MSFWSPGTGNPVAAALVPITDALYDLGSAILRWRDLYLSRNAVIGGNLTVNGNTILGDANTDTVSLGNGDIQKDTNGNIFGLRIHNNASPLAGATNQPVGASGTYTPALVNGANVAASVAQKAFWDRTGNKVNVKGSLTLDPTAGAVTTTIAIALPIASNLAAITDANGIAIRATVAVTTALVAFIQGDAANNRVDLTFVNDADVANRTWVYDFSYEVLA